MPTLAANLEEHLNSFFVCMPCLRDTYHLLFPMYIYATLMRVDWLGSHAAYTNYISILFADIKIPMNKL